MSTMKLDRIRDKQGKFVYKEDRAIVKSIRLPQYLIDEVEKVMTDGEMFSDVVRKAIALYLTECKEIR